MPTNEHQELTEVIEQGAGFRSHFLSRTCPILKAAKAASAPSDRKELCELFASRAWRNFLRRLGVNRNDPCADHTVSLLNVRTELVQVCFGYSDIEPALATALQKLHDCWSVNFESKIRQQFLGVNATGQASNEFNQKSFEKTAVCRQLPESLQDVFRGLAGEYGWLHPGMLMLADAATYITPGARRIAPDSHSVETYIVFALVYNQSGHVAELKLERIPTNVDAGCGAMYPDPLSSGYFKWTDTFQRSLQHAWWAEIGRHHTEIDFDIRWSLKWAGDHGRSNCDANQLDKRRLWLNPLDGHSGEASLACGLRALRLGERLSASVAASSQFVSPFDEKDFSLSRVGSVPIKLTASEFCPEVKEMEQRRIFEFVTHWSDSVFEDQIQDGERPSDDLHMLLDEGRFRVTGVTDLDRCYTRLSRFTKLTDYVKRRLKERAELLLADTCNPHISSSMSRRQSGQEGERIPVSDEERLAILSGKNSGTATGQTRRTVLWAESGLGKSTILIEAEGIIAASPDDLIPLRVGAGPASTGSGINPVPIRLPLLSDFDWNREDIAALLDELAEQLLKPYLPPGCTPQERSDWFKEAIARGNVVFLLDSLDQTKGPVEFNKFLNRDGVSECSVILTARPETIQTKRDAYQTMEWDRVWLDPFDESRVRQFCGNKNVANLLWWTRDWSPLVQVPVLLHQMKKLAFAENPDGTNRLKSLLNREAVYYATLQMLVEHSHRSLGDSGLEAQRCLQRTTRLLSQIAWETVVAESQHGADSANFTGMMPAIAYESFEASHEQELGELGQLNLTTRESYLDEFGMPGTTLSWRHFSYCEWFAGLYLASFPADEIEKLLKVHCRDPRWEWIIRFAVSSAVRLKDEQAVSVFAEGLLKYGAAFLLIDCLSKDGLGSGGMTPFVPKDMTRLTRWLTAFDCADDSAFKNPATNKPVVDARIAGILDVMFGIDPNTGEPEPCRDSRWLWPAWELVQDGCESADPNVAQTCAGIRNQFLNEFEERVNLAAQKYRQQPRSSWQGRDRGLLELVPDDELLRLGLIDEEHYKTITIWPDSEAGTWERRRDMFNDRQQKSGANFCLCPPLNWEHPHGDSIAPYTCWVYSSEGKVDHTFPQNYWLQRTPVTNLQFEAFDPLHFRERRMEWSRSEEDQLDDHPVVDVSWYQATMFCIWLTGANQRFGQFQLPHEKDWEACCRAGRDQENEHYGIPLSDGTGTVLDEHRRERFDALSSFAANFSDFKGYSVRDVRKPYLGGTCSVVSSSYPGNGWGLRDLHGQVWEWQSNMYAHEHGYDHSVRGGSWFFGAWDCNSSSLCTFQSFNLFRGSLGFRLSRTRSS